MFPGKMYIIVYNFARFITKTLYSFETSQYMSSLYVGVMDPRLSGNYECQATYSGKSVRAQVLILIKGKYWLHVIDQSTKMCYYSLLHLQV